MSTAPLPPSGFPQPPAGPSGGSSTPLGTVTPISASAAAANAAAWGVSGSPNAGGGPGSTGYDATTYYVAAKNAQGNYEHMRIKMLPWQHRVLMGLKDDLNHPAYKSVDDVIRDAITHLLHLRDTQNRAGIFTVAMQDALDKTIQDQALQDAEEKLDFYVTTLERSTGLFEQYVKHEMWETLHSGIATNRDKSDCWEGDLRRSMMKLCDDYEKLIPADIIF